MSSGEISLSFNAEPISINIQLAVPLGLVINEIVSNALKYAFPDNIDGLISIDGKAWRGKGLYLRISDDGVGLKKGFDPTQSKSMGMRIIQDIVELQLFGEIHLNRDSGVEYVIQIPSLSLE